MRESVSTVKINVERKRSKADAYTAAYTAVYTLNMAMDGHANVQSSDIHRKFCTQYNSTTVQQYTSQSTLWFQQVQSAVNSELYIQITFCWIVYSLSSYFLCCELHPYNNRRTSLKISTHSHIYINLRTWFWNTRSVTLVLYISRWNQCATRLC